MVTAPSLSFGHVTPSFPSFLSCFIGVLLVLVFLHLLLLKKYPPPSTYLCGGGGGGRRGGRFLFRWVCQVDSSLGRPGKRGG